MSLIMLKEFLAEAVAGASLGALVESVSFAQLASTNLTIMLRIEVTRRQAVLLAPLDSMDLLSTSYPPLRSSLQAFIHHAVLQPPPGSLQAAIPTEAGISIDSSISIQEVKTSHQFFPLD